MAIWPFGKKGKRRGHAKGPSIESGKDIISSRVENPPEANQPQPRSQLPERISSRRSSRRRVPNNPQDSNNALLTEKPRSRKSSPVKKPEVPPASSRKHDSTTGRADVPSYYFHHPGSHSSISTELRESWPKPPTLQTRRNASDSTILRHRSSRHRRDDHIREEEIRRTSTSPSIPIRPATQSGSMFARDNRKLHSRQSFPNRPMSQTSAHQPESMYSSASLGEDRYNFKIRPLDVFAPRPTIRYSDGSTYGSRVPSRASSKREKRPALSDDVLSASNRIDELADDLDATGLRQVMERDRRRREQKKRDEEARMQRRLQRRADRQKWEEEEAARETAQSQQARNKSPEPSAVGLGIGEEPPIPGEAQLARALDDKEEMQIDPSFLHDASTEHLPLDPFTDHDQEVHTMPILEAGPVEVKEEPEHHALPPLQRSQVTLSPPPTPLDSVRTDRNVPQPADVSGDLTKEQYDPSDSDRRASESSSHQNYVKRWRTFLRGSSSRGKRTSADRLSQTPSDFSNASRDSLARHSAYTPVSAGFKRRSAPSGRTTSKFREDLPELPLSPPESRVTSTEPGSMPDINRERWSQGQASSAAVGRTSVLPGSSSPVDPFEDPNFRQRNETSMSGHRSSEALSFEGKAPSTVVSQSLASIDSEGSWLSGRATKRGSQPAAQTLRNSASSLQRRLQEFSDSGDDLGVAEDEYLTRLAPGGDMYYADDRAGIMRKSSSIAVASTDDGNDDSPAKVRDQSMSHGTVGRKPTIVHHGSRAKSSEGLLNQFQTDEADLPQAVQPKDLGREAQQAATGESSVPEAQKA